MPTDPFTAAVAQLLDEPVALPEHTASQVHRCPDWYGDELAAQWLIARGQRARYGRRRPMPDAVQLPADDSEGGTLD